MEDLLNTRQLAQRLGVSPGTLRNRRSENLGPPFKRIGRTVRYDLREVLHWIEKSQ
jgi:predicted DNA-binding transcriptional regulator AlpA